MLTVACCLLADKYRQKLGLTQGLAVHLGCRSPALDSPPRRITHAPVSMHSIPTALATLLKPGTCLVNLEKRSWIEIVCIRSSKH